MWKAKVHELFDDLKHNSTKVCGILEKVKNASTFDR